MCGNGSYKKLISLVNDYGISERTMFTGFISNRVHYLSAMDVFLLSSHTEGTSMTLLAAMGLGIPAIATRMRGTPEIIKNGVTGILTDLVHTLSFAIAVEAFCENKNLRAGTAEAVQNQFNGRF